MHAVVMILQILRTGEQVVTESTIMMPRTLCEVLLQCPHSGKIPVTVPTKRIHAAKSEVKVSSIVMYGWVGCYGESWWSLEEVNEFDCRVSLSL